MPMISIITPVYNVEKYIHRCIDSILAQTFSDFELILVDDGSPDKCGFICDTYASKDSRIRVIHQHNQGQAVAKNHGIDIAQGKYLAFCDSDDYWEHSLLERCFQTAEQHHADVIHFNYIKSINNKIVKETQFLPGLFDLQNDEGRVDYLIQTLLQHKHGWEMVDRLFRKDIVDAYNIRCCTTSNNFGEDLSFVCKYMLHASRVFCLEDKLYHYCVREGSAMQSSIGMIRLNDMVEVSYNISQEFFSVISDKKLLNRYPIIHLMLMNDQIIGMGSRGQYNLVPVELKKLHKAHWSKQTIRSLFSCCPDLEHYFGSFLAKRVFLFASYMLHGNWKLYCFESAVFHKLFKR